jgi:hypothetical protein
MFEPCAMKVARTPKQHPRCLLGDLIFSVSYIISITHVIYYNLYNYYLYN